MKLTAVGWFRVYFAAKRLTRLEQEKGLRVSALRQYRAGLDMLRLAIELCPEDLWSSSEYRSRLWHIAYHSLFYTHLYVQPSWLGIQLIPFDKIELQFYSIAIYSTIPVS